MKNRLTLLTVFVVAAVAAVGPSILSQSSAHQQADESKRNRETDRNQFMRRKLFMVQQVVEGISTEDFELVKKGGMELLALSEEAAWKSTDDPFYRHYSANFEHATRGLIDAAQSKSVEKTTFAYVHITMSCTACHQHVRNTVRVAR